MTIRSISVALRAAAVMGMLSTILAAPAPAGGDPLQVDTLSSSSTLPGPDGLRLVSVSFRVTNTSTPTVTAPQPAIATIAFNANSATLDVPALQPGASAYVSRTVQTASLQVAISISVTTKPLVVHKSKIAKPVSTSISKAKTAATPATAAMQYTITVAGDVGRWQSVGPFKIARSPAASGRVTTIAIDPRNPEIVYAGARGSGLWRTLGIRMIWLPITDSLPSQQIEAVALDPNNPDHVVIATGAGVFESVNDGSVWTLLTSKDLNAIGSDGGKLLIAAGPTPSMLVTTTSGVMTSTDGGRNWTTVLSSTANVQSSSIQFSSLDATHVFATLGVVDGHVATAAAPPGVFEARGGGTTPTTWHRLQGCPGAPLPDIPLSSNVWVSESQGSMWVSYRSGVADNQQLGLLRSTSDTCQPNGFTEHGWQSVPLSSGCSDYINNWSYLFVDPTDPSVIYKGGVGLCRATGSGASSSLLSNIHEDQHAIAVAPSNSSIIYFGSDGGIYRSNDHGQTLSFAGEGMSNTEFLSADVDGSGFAIVGASQDNGVESWDGTSSSVWKFLDAGDGILVSVDRADPTSIYWMSQDTTSLSHNQNQIANGSQPIDDCYAYGEFPAKVSVGMISTGITPAVYATCKGLWTGPPWSKVQTDNGNNFVRLGFLKGMVAAATDSGDVFYGTAPASRLDYIFHDANSGSASSITFASQNTFYVSMNSSGKGSIYRLQNSTGWTSENAWPGNISGEITAITVDPLVPDTLLAAVRNSGIFRGTRASGGTWTWLPYNDGLPAAITITDLKASVNGSIAAVSYGRGAYLLTSVRRLPVPNILGLSEANARDAITSSGYVTANVSYSFSATAPAGNVTAQNPVAGIIGVTGSGVNFTVATGGVLLPNLISLSQSEAITAISQLGLVPKVGFQKKCVNPGDVLVQSPPAGTTVAPNTTVNITVDSGTFKTCPIK